MPVKRTKKTVVVKRLSPEGEAKLVATVLAVRDLTIVLLANQASNIKDPDSYFRRLSNGLSQRIDEGDIEMAFAELVRHEHDRLLDYARRLCQDRN